MLAAKSRALADLQKKTLALEEKTHELEARLASPGAEAVGSRLVAAGERRCEEEEAERELSTRLEDVEQQVLYMC